MKVIRWEYKILPQKIKDPDVTSLTSRLNTLGHHGWEYVATSTWCNANNPTSPQQVYWIFKRPAGYMEITLD